MHTLLPSLSLTAALSITAADPPAFNSLVWLHPTRTSFSGSLVSSCWVLEHQSILCMGVCALLSAAPSVLHHQCCLPVCGRHRHQQQGQLARAPRALGRGSPHTHAADMGCCRAPSSSHQETPRPPQTQRHVHPGGASVDLPAYLGGGGGGGGGDSGDGDPGDDEPDGRGVCCWLVGACCWLWLWQADTAGFWGGNDRQPMPYGVLGWGACRQRGVLSCVCVCRPCCRC